jgi:small-conductance mechanosensitive channel
VPDLWRQPWLAWTIGIAIGLPVVLVLLTELHHWLARTGSRMVKAVAMLRTYVVPSLALLLLLTKGAGIQFQVTGVRLVATVFALLLLLLVLSSLNVALFGRASAGSWRNRVPTIFIEIVRVVIVGVGLAILLSQVWGADVGGLFTALGVTSLVIGLALQSAAGSVVSGLLLLFEQPFTLGDYLQTSTGKVPGVEGRVVEVNWRAVHIDTGGAICIVPNALLAQSAFSNLSRPSTAVSETVATKFANDDSPVQVCALLERLAADLPGSPAGSGPVASVKGGGAYEVVLQLQNLADIAGSRSLFLSWQTTAS